MGTLAEDSSFVGGRVRSGGGNAARWGVAAEQTVMQPDATPNEIAAHLGIDDLRIVERVMTSMRYAGYIVRQESSIRRQREADGRHIPEWLDASEVTGLRTEAAESLARFRPSTLGQAGRLAGVSPADLSLLSIAIRRGCGSD